MSILIKGLSISSNDTEWKDVLLTDDGRAICDRTAYEVVEVPDGHGKMTNADRIRHASDDELENILNAMAGCVELVEKDWICEDFGKCEDCRNTWLKEEVKD